MAKLKVMNSIIGLNPPYAAPIPRAANPVSVIGVSIILFDPNYSHKPLETLYAP